MKSYLVLSCRIPAWQIVWKSRVCVEEMNSNSEKKICMNNICNIWEMGLWFCWQRLSHSCHWLDSKLTTGNILDISVSYEAACWVIFDFSCVRAFKQREREGEGEGEGEHIWLVCLALFSLSLSLLLTS